MNHLTLAVGIELHLDAISRQANLPPHYVRTVLEEGANSIKPHYKRPTGAQFRALFESLMTLLDVDYKTATAIVRFGVNNARLANS